jgi:hypothetical protein
MPDEQMHVNQQDNNLNENTGVDNRGSHHPSDDPSAIFSGGSSLQTPEEFKQDKETNHAESDNTIVTGGVDDLQSNSDGAAGTDRAGTAERKNYGGPKLNESDYDKQ